MKRVIVVILNFEISNALTRYNFWSTNTTYPKVSEACELIKIIVTDKKINKYIEVYTVYIYIYYFIINCTNINTVTSLTLQI